MQARLRLCVSMDHVNYDSDIMRGVLLGVEDAVVCKGRATLQVPDSDMIRAKARLYTLERSITCGCLCLGCTVTRC